MLKGSGAGFHDPGWLRNCVTWWVFGSVARHIYDIGSCGTECSREYEDVVPSIGNVSKAHRSGGEVGGESIAIARAGGILGYSKGNTSSGCM